MDSCLQDLRFGLRALARRPSFTLVAILTLALGFGANITMLSFAEALVWHDLPYEDAEDLVMLWRKTDQHERSALSFPAYLDWEARNRVFSSFDVFNLDYNNLTGPHGDPERVESLLVSAGFAATLGVEPRLGRFFTPEDDRPGAERTVVLSYGLWQRRFGGDEGILQDTISLNDELFTPIGVLPPELDAERLGGTSLGDVWLPIRLFSDSSFDKRESHFLHAVGRLRPGLSLKRAREDMARVTRELGKEYPLTEANTRAGLAPVLEDVLGDLKQWIYVLLLTVGSVLVIACVNLMNLLLTRAAIQHREIAVRSAMGADGGRLVRQMLTECLLLAVGGAILGLPAAGLAVRLLPALLPGIQYADGASLSAPVLGITAVLILLVTLAIGLVPAVSAVRPGWLHSVVLQPVGSLQDPLTRSLPRQKRWRQILVVAELALAVVVLSCAGLALGSFKKLHDQDPGFRSDGILTLLTAPPDSKYGDDAAWTSFFDETLARLGVLPGVERVTVTSLLPLGTRRKTSPVVAGDRPLPAVGEWEVTIYQMVSPGYFRTMGIPLREGRDFTSADDDRLNDHRVVVISEALARHFWGDRSPVGERLGFELTGSPSEFEVLWREVVGVVGDVRSEGLRVPPRFTVYVPYTQISLWHAGGATFMAIALKTSVEPEGLVRGVRSEIAQIDPSLPLFSIRSLQEIVAEHLESSLMAATLLTAIAGLALVLALVGIYGVVSYTVVAQQHDLGVRMAVGASPWQILTGVLREGFVLIVSGVGLGLVLAWVVARYVMPTLFETQAADPFTFAAVALLLVFVALAATLVPAVQAMRLAPSKVLHWE